jgi:streptogramin lyase
MFQGNPMMERRRHLLPALLNLECLEDRFLPSVSFHSFATTTGASGPFGITKSNDQNIWFTEQAANKIGRITNFGVITEFSIPTAASGPTGITGGPDANTWFTEQNANAIGRITIFGQVTEFSGLTAGSQPTGITQGSDSNLWFTEVAGNKIGRITTSGTVAEFLIPTPASDPLGITSGPDGNLWFTEAGGNKIGRITPSGQITEFGGLTAGSQPTGITVGPDGNLWFTEPGTGLTPGHGIGRITPTGTVTEFMDSAMTGASGITAGPDGNLWFTQATGLGRITPGGSFALFPTAFNSLPNIALGSNGNLWFTEQGNAAIGEAVLPHYLVTGSDAGSTPMVHVYNAFTGALITQFNAYDVGFQGGVRVALGDVTGDGIPNIITAPGPSGGPDIRVFDVASGKIVDEFMAFDPAFTGGVFVASGEFDGDNQADIVVGADAGGGPEVRIFSGATLQPITSFFAYNVGFPGGVRVAAGDVTGTGHDDLITAAGPGGGPHVEVFDGATFQVVQSFMAYDIGFTGGVYVAAGDTTGSGVADIITGAGAGGGPHVKVFSGLNPALVLQSYFAYDAGFTGGVRVAALDVNTDGIDDIVTGAGPGGGPHVQVFEGTNLAVLDSFFAYSPTFTGGVFVGGQ